MNETAIGVMIGSAVLTGLVLFVPRMVARAGATLRMVDTLRQLRSARHNDRTLLRAYHDGLRMRADDALSGVASCDLPPSRISERTWADLNMDELFDSLDYAISEPGRQYLYHMLRCPHERAGPLQKLDRAVQRLGDEALSDRVRRALQGLSDKRAAYLQQLVLGELPARPRLWWLAPVLTSASLLCLASLALWSSAAIAWLGICVVNAGVQLVYRPRVKHLVVALHEMPAFLDAARELGAMDIVELADKCRVLREGAERLSSVRRATRWLMFEPSQSSEMAGWLYEYVNLLFLLDVNAFVFTSNALRAARGDVHHMFEALGHIDAVQSIDQWRRGLEPCTVPEFTGADKRLHVRSLVHPLLANPAPNDFEMHGTGVVITGSNMSGKTTFIRAIGVNAILAQTLCTACAVTWRAPLLRVRTSIGRDDSLMEGKSYYLAEVESILALVTAQESGVQHLFLLDEIFRGTNTTERVAAGYAVLQHLNSGKHLVVAATHDIEVLDLLGDRYAAHHFREQVDGGGLTFDYTLRPGPASTRNAIALLRTMRYPESLVEAALAAIDWRVRGDRREQVLAESADEPVA